MQRIERDEIGVQIGNGPVDQVAQIAEIAAAPVPYRTNSVECDAQSGVFSGFRRIRAIRTDDHAHRLSGRLDVVIPERQFVERALDAAVFPMYFEMSQTGNRDGFVL